jgi:glycine/D-amino acid oxidase-like deaminating enzyme
MSNLVALGLLSRYVKRAQLLTTGLCQNGGHCQPMLYKDPHNSFLGSFELENVLQNRAFVKENNIDCDWQDVESCHAYTTSSYFDADVKKVELLRTLKPELADLITIVRPNSTSPSFADLQLGEKVVGAILSKNAAGLWPYKLVAWILERLLSTKPGAAADGVGSFNLQTHTPVMRLEKLKGPHRGLWGVHTDRGMVTADYVLLATNAYTSFLLPAFAPLIAPCRGQMSALIPPPELIPGTGKPLHGKNSYGFWGKGSAEGGGYDQDDYLIQRPAAMTTDKPGGGELMFGGGRDLEVKLGIYASDDSEINKGVAKYLRTELTRNLKLRKETTELQASHEWTGIMGFSKDEYPWVGKVPPELGGNPFLWMTAGFTGHGMPQANLCAKAVIGMMFGKRQSEVYLPHEFHITIERARAAQMKTSWSAFPMIDPSATEADTDESDADMPQKPIQPLPQSSCCNMI